MPRAGLTPDTVAACAGDLADRDGYDRLSLAAVAAQLGVRLPSLYPGAKPADFAEQLGALKANLAEPGRWAAVAAMARAGHAAAEAALPQVSAPALVVMGSKDPDFPDPAAEALLTAERLAGLAEVVMVDGAGHYPHAERPDVVSPRVIGFLAASLPAR